MTPQNEEKTADRNYGLPEESRGKMEARDRAPFLLSLVSHQIRAPLAIIKGYVTLLREGHYGELSDKAKEVARKIEFTVDELVELLSNVIDLRKVEEGKMEYEFSRTDLVGLAKDVVNGFMPLAEQKKLDLSFRASAHDIFVSADPRELKHVVQNLIDNAIKYTPKGFIKVETQTNDGEVVLSVADSGIGIAPGVKPLLFNEFVRDERVRMDVRGSGIGLHIAKSIIEAHGGKIWCESGGEGKGSVFYVSLKKIE